MGVAVRTNRCHRARAQCLFRVTSLSMLRKPRIPVLRRLVLHAIQGHLTREAATYRFELGALVVELLKRKKLPIRDRAADSSLRNFFPRLVFEDTLTAFEHACNGECLLHEGIMMPALVLDAEIQCNGRQTASVRVASADGGFIVSASTGGSRGPRLRPGHFVAWQAQWYDPQAAKKALPTHKRFGLFGLKDKRIGWVGLIAGTLKPEYRDGGWIGDERFFP